MEIETENLKYILIITYGRSGSTLLQGILNTSPHIHITGENGDFIYGMFKSITSLKHAKDIAGINKFRDAKHPFFGIDFFSDEEIIRDFRKISQKQLMKSIPQGKEVRFLGFKEIRYPYKKDPGAYISFISEMFDSPLILFLFRDLGEVLSSGMFQKLTDAEKVTTKEIFRGFEETCRKFSAHYDKSLILRYEEIIADPEQMIKQLSTLGIHLGLESVLGAMSSPHSYTWNPENV